MTLLIVLLLLALLGGGLGYGRFGPKVTEICLMARAAGHTPLPLAALPRRARRLTPRRGARA